MGASEQFKRPRIPGTGKGEPHDPPPAAMTSRHAAEGPAQSSPYSSYANPYPAEFDAATPRLIAEIRKTRALRWVPACDVDVVIQESLVGIWRQWSKFRSLPDSRQRSYLHQVVVYQAMGYLFEKRARCGIGETTAARMGRRST